MKASNAHHHELAADSTFAQRLRREPSLLRVAAGRVWVTLESEPRDFVLGPGESLVVRGPGRLVVLAVDAARFAIDAAPRVTHLAA